MNGQYAIKGYLIQSLVALLDSFQNDWKSVCVEPNDESEKVDITWTYEDGKVKVVQVKSSKNIINYSNAKKWANELYTTCSNANEHELILVGYVDSKIKNLPDNTIENVRVINKDFSIDDFENIIITKINTFYDCKGKNPISPRLGLLFARALNSQVLEDSVIGKSISHSDFENSLLNSLQAIEKHLERSPYSLLLPEEPINNKDVKSAIMERVFELIGWKQMSTNESITVYNEKLGQDQNYKIDYWGNYDCPLKDNLKDIVYVNTEIDAEYQPNYSDTVRERLFSVDSIRKNLIESNRIDTNEAIEYCVHFLLSLKYGEQSLSYSQLNDAYKGKLLDKNLIYYVVDNKKADFLISSIITARKYRDDVITKFLYPITDDNSRIDKIGKRGAYMPPQYLNSSIIPIVKEDNNKISVLLFCSDPYSKDRLKKVIWLLIRLTSGLANEYRIYFTDFDDNEYGNEVNEVIRSYNNNELTNRISIEKLRLCNSIDLQYVPHIGSNDYKDEDFDDTANIKKRLKVEPHLIDYLPYGDSLKPFLASDAVKSEDLKLFLHNKGVIFKTADKKKIIQLMTSMLFSSLDIDALVQYVNVDKKAKETSSVCYPLIDKNKQVTQVCSNIVINQKMLQEGLKADIVYTEQIPQKKDEDIVGYRLCLEQKNPNQQALVSIVRSEAKVYVKKDSTSNNLEFVKECDSKVARVAAERLEKQISQQLIQKKIIEEKAIEIRFSDFTNIDRVNFLLSFTDTGSSNIFANPNAKSFKYGFDESDNLPEEYKDKVGKECITELNGKKLHTIKELQDENLKKIIYGEELSINYRYKIRGGISGNYFVILNFSGALKNKPSPDGLFNIKTKFYIDTKDKCKIPNVSDLEIELKKEFNKLKKEKLQLFNKI